jgi:hypothetical protein
MPYTQPHGLSPSAGDQEWKAVRVLIYPWPGGVYLALERRDGRGGAHRDVRLLGGPLELEHQLDPVGDISALLEAVAEAMLKAADRTQTGRRTATNSPA